MADVEDDELTYEQHRARNLQIAHELLDDLHKQGALHYFSVGVHPVPDEDHYIVHVAGTSPQRPLMARSLRFGAGIVDKLIARQKLH